MSRHQTFCTFHLGDLYLGVRVQEVQEVIRFQEMTRVPLASPCVRGLINLRGQIVTAIDLRVRFGIEPRAADRRPMNVVVRTADGAVSLLVDEIGDVLDVAEDSFEPAPPTLSAESRALIAGVYGLDSRLLLALHTRRALDLSTMQHRSAPARLGLVAPP